MPTHHAVSLAIIPAMLDRYQKQRRFEPIGDAGQEKLSKSTVVVIGCGALGALASEQLVRSGVGHVKIIDRDFVEWSNLQRQALFTEADAEQRIPKAIAAATHLEAINSDVEIEPIVSDFSRRTHGDVIAEGVDLVIDGTDNLETRYLINEVCLDRAIPWVYGGCVGSQGQAALFFPRHTPCLRCLFPDLPAPGETETCDTLGVIAPAAHTVASFQVGLALRALVESPIAAGGQMQFADVWDGMLRTVRLNLTAGCPTCRDGERPFLNGEQGGEVAVLCGRNAVQVTPESGAHVDMQSLESKLALVGHVESNRFLLRARPTECPDLEMTIFRDGRVIVQGTEDATVARSAVAKFVGT